MVTWLVDGEELGQMFHLFNSGQMNTVHDNAAHQANPFCWCEPHMHHFGYDLAGRAIIVLNHHQQGLFCCTKHSDAKPEWFAPYQPAPGTGPYSDDSELEEEVVTIG